MARLLKIGIGAMLIGTGAAAATGVGYYAHQQSHKHSQQTSGEYLKDIYEQISTLPGSDGSTWNDFHDFEQDLLSRISSSHTDVKKTVTTMLEDELDIIVTNVQTDLAANNAGVKFIGDQLEQYNNDVSDALDILDDGIVGSHDLNYYADLISTKVDKTILASTEDELNQKITDTKERVTSLQESLTTDMANKHGEIQTNLAAIKKEFNDKVTATTAEITTLQGSVAALNLSTNTTIASLETSITDFKTEINNIKAEFDKRQTDIDNALQNNLLRYSDLQTLFESMILEVQKLNETIIDNESKFNLALEIVKSDQANAALDITAIKTSIDNLSTDLDVTRDIVNVLKDDIEVMNQLIIKNDDEIKIIKENLAGLNADLNLELDSISDQLLTNTDQYHSNLAVINNLIAKFDVVERKLTDNKDDIIRNGTSIDIATDKIATILFDLDQVVINATENERKIYEVEEMVKNYEATNGGQMVSEYETSYSELPDDIMTNRIYLANPIGDYATIFVTLRLHHDYTLPQTMIISPEAGKKEGVQWFRGNGAVNAILVSVLFIVDYDDNSIRVTAIQFHNVMSWTHGTISNMRGILSK